ncbi:GNAT family protein [Sporosarcina jeotgali]|uniref:GNAT family protein n=1 Tax=Sporosarcina jeotgali TaxID=3020056 RepID=A0ABZ0KTX5_9BACL|nr:GNAT family protein [Sporosarcina sp. B2O-1]WOV83700.1 GNAT family protein [Sporosarcina sp. B2O-1]
MNFIFSKMSQQQAENIASNWHYEDEYSFYDVDADEEDLIEFLDPKQREDIYYIVREDDEEIGFFSFDYKAGAVDIGLGMQPELTGRGLGLEFFKAGLKFAISQFTPNEITLSVATFNDRAIKVYKKAGFEPGETFMQDTNGSRFEFLKMKYDCASK